MKASQPRFITQTPDGARSAEAVPVDGKESRAAFLTALTTEHFVLQTAANATYSDGAGRSSLYVVSLSSSLIAIGFASRSGGMFVAFTAMALLGVFVLGLFTIVRLVDSALENMRCLEGIARIRAFYRTLTPDAEGFFAPRYGRWPEGPEPSQQGGLLLALSTTSAASVSVINSIVGGSWVALMAGELLDQPGSTFVVALGALTWLVLSAMFVAYERRRFLARLPPRGDPPPGSDAPSGST